MAAWDKNQLSVVSSLNLERSCSAPPSKKEQQPIWSGELSVSEVPTPTIRKVPLRKALSLSVSSLGKVEGPDFEVYSPRSHDEMRRNEKSPVVDRPPGLLRLATKDIDTVEVSTNKFGQKQVNQYIIIKQLGKGVSGKVKLVYDPFREVFFAMKVMSKAFLKRRRRSFFRPPVVGGRPRRMSQPPDPWENVKREIAIMKKLRHDNIVRLYEVIDDEKSDNLYLIMDYAEQGSIFDGNLNDFVAIPEDLARAYFRDLVSGLTYLHQNGVIHRDIKLANLLLSRISRVMIADFGVSMQSEDTVSDHVGTPAFMAPEMCAKKQEFSGQLADIWACGVCLYFLVKGKLPFNGKVPMIYDIILKEPLTFPKDPPISKELMHLLSLLLEKNPAKRITLEAIMVHPWVTCGGYWKFPPVVPFAQMDCTEEEMSRAIGVGRKVNPLHVIAKIRIAFKKRAEEARMRLSPRTQSEPVHMVLSPRSEERIVRAEAISKQLTPRSSAVLSAVRNAAYGDSPLPLNTDGAAFTPPTLYLPQPCVPARLEQVDEMEDVEEMETKEDAVMDESV